MKIERRMSEETKAPAFFVQGHEFTTRSQARNYLRSLKKRTKIPRPQGDWSIPGMPVESVTLAMALEVLGHNPDKMLRRDR